MKEDVEKSIPMKEEVIHHNSPEKYPFATSFSQMYNYIFFVILKDNCLGRAYQGPTVLLQSNI